MQLADVRFVPIADIPASQRDARLGLLHHGFYRFAKINGGVTSVARHETLRAREQKFLGPRIRESCCAYTGLKFQEYWQTVFGSHNNG